MKDDHLNKEVSLSAELTPTGLRAGANSRLVSAVDRLLGGAVDLMSPAIEGIAQRARAKNAADVSLIEALGARRVAMVHADPAFAERAMEQHLNRIGRRYGNKSAAVAKAIEDLRESPPSEEQSAAGPAELDPDFVARFERYAEDATSDHLRERWGRVLAAEVRAPGTFSSKVLRCVDEMDAETARAFEDFAAHRLAGGVPKALSGELAFADQVRLVTAGLILEPGIAGHLMHASSVTDASGTSLWVFFLGDGAVSVTPPFEVKDPSNPWFGKGDAETGPTISTYVLTDTGNAIASILTDKSFENANKIFLAVSGALSSGVSRLYRKTPDGQLVPVEERSAG